jgi:hypothetical protein
MSGRKPKQESRAAEFRQRLATWKQTPVPLRPSLRALARQLHTSHQLLEHYLAGLEKWQQMERCRKAEKESEEIRACAKTEGRPMTQWEEERVDANTRVQWRAALISGALDLIEKMKCEAKRGPLHWTQIKLLKVFASKGFTGAQELLQKCSQSSVKDQKNNLPVISPAAAKSFRTA